MIKPAAIVLLAIVSCVAVAQDQAKYQCSNGDLERRVEIVYETGVAVPCEVHYYKDTEAPGERQVLWSAANQSGYCESRAREFVAQLEDWGWDCGAGDEAEAEQTDDTEALAPAESEEQG